VSLPETSGPIRVLLADDHAVLRSGLKLMLDARSDMTVVGEVGDGVDVLPLALETNPDIILLDLTMPRLGGLEALSLLRERAPGIRVLILTMHDDQGYLRQALRMGAAGYVLKKAADVELIAAIQAVMRGDVYVHPSMTRSLLDEMLPENEGGTGEEDVWLTLSEREQEVLRLVALGHTNQEIADRLSLSVKTVETYRARGMEKLALRSRAALVRFALAKGLLD
jgi:two-component system, NarL family, response regulator NreC